MKTQLSDKALELIKEFSALSKAGSQRKMQLQGIMSLDEHFKMDFDELIDLYFDNQDNFLQPTKSQQPAIYNNRISLLRTESQTI